MEIVNQNCTSLKVTSSIIASAPEGSTFRLQIGVNCCSTIFDDLVTPEDDDSILIASTLFGLDILQSGIYSIKLIRQSSNNAQPPVITTTTDDNCVFIDCNFKCDFKNKIEALLTTGVSEDKQTALESIMLHYALTNSSGCGCNCAELCNLYRQLYKLTYGDNLPSSYDIQITDCGC